MGGGYALLLSTAFLIEQSRIPLPWRRKNIPQVINKRNKIFKLTYEDL